MKLLKTLFIALVGLALTNCTIKEEDHVQQIGSSVSNLEQAKAAFETNYAEHLRYVQKRTNQLRRNESISREVLQQEFESQWTSHLEKLNTLTKFLSKEDLELYLDNLFKEYKAQGIVATPCYDAYVKSLAEADTEFIICGILAVATGGEGIPVCVIYYFNSLRKAYNTYLECMATEYGGIE